MGSNTKQLCRLCLQTSDDVVNIWETFLDSTIASILAKHFWFQVHKNDGLTESICEHCWTQTKTFHEFYRQVEQFQKCFWDSVANDKSVQDPTIHVDRQDVALDSEPDLNVVKCEEEQVKSETTHLPLSSRNSSDHNEDNISDESEMDQTVDDEDQCSNNASKSGNNRTLRSNSKKSDRLSISEKLELEGQIRDLFNMNCEICSDVKFKNLLQARRHYRNVHEKDGYIKCCDKKFRERAEVVQHIRHHVNLTAHGPSEQMEQEAQIRELFGMKCEICSDSVEFVTLLEVRQHYRKVHKTRGYLTCCDKKFYRRCLMMEHVRWHTNSYTYSCDECGKRFSNKCAIRSHVAVHISPEARPFKCTLCPRRFIRKGGLQVHVQYNHNEGGNYTCESCGKNFRSSLQLASHIRNVHEMTADYVCEICARKFKSKPVLQNHIDRVHLKTPPEKVQCEICGVWLRKRSIELHGRRVHMKSKPVNCTICNKMVSSESQLPYHIRYVHGERQHRCHLCGKRFKIAKILKEHLAVHTGQDLYDCPYCEKKFKSNANLYNHRKKAHSAQYNAQQQQSNVTNEREQKK